MLAHGILAQSQYAAPAAGPAWVTDSLYIYADPFAGFDGSTITDLSGNANTITRINSITTTGAIGGTGGWNLNATGTSAKGYYHSNPITSATDFSCEAWFWADGSTTNDNNPNIYRSFIGNFDIAMYMWHGNNQFYTYIQSQEGTSSQIGNGASIKDGNWRQFVITWDNSTYTLTLYINGSSVTSTTQGSGTYYASGANFAAMGPASASTILGFSGALGGLTRLYTKKLDDAEVLQNYDANKADYGLS